MTTTATPPQVAQSDYYVGHNHMGEKVIYFRSAAGPQVVLHKRHVGLDALWDTIVAAVSTVPRTARVSPARNTDPGTSHQGAREIVMRAESQRTRLLNTYAVQVVDGSEYIGQTADGAGAIAGLLRSCYWKRISELREAGLIEPTGEVRKGTHSGGDQMVCRITPAGLETLRRLKNAERAEREDES